MLEVVDKLLPLLENAQQGAVWVLIVYLMQLPLIWFMVLTVASFLVVKVTNTTIRKDEISLKKDEIGFKQKLISRGYASPKAILVGEEEWYKE